MNYLLNHLPEIGVLTLQHVALAGAGLALALAVAIPLGVAAARRPAFDAAIFGGAGLLYVIPSLALLALAVQYVGRGFWTVVLVLAAYAQFILVRAVATAIRSVAAPQIDAALGLGMSGWQRFVRVEIPQAAPVFLGGVRLAAIALISIATLGGYVSAGGLGDEIFSGLQRQYVPQVLAGSIPAALLAVAAHAIFRALENAAARRITG